MVRGIRGKSADSTRTLSRQDSLFASVAGFRCRRALLGSASAAAMGVMLLAGGATPASACTAFPSLPGGGDLIVCVPPGPDGPVTGTGNGDALFADGVILDSDGTWSVQMLGGDDYVSIADSIVNGWINGNGGNDTIIIEDSTISDLRGGAGNDDLSVAGSIAGNIHGDLGDDSIYVGGSTVGNVYGDNGDVAGSNDGPEDYGNDSIIIGSSTVNGDIYGDSPLATSPWWGGDDEIVVRSLSSALGDTHVNGSIYGGGGDDSITAFATNGGLVRGNDIFGGTGDDEIVLRATRGGEVDFDEINGGWGNDDITVIADRGGRVEIDDGIEGGRGYDDIVLRATRGGDIRIDGDIDGGGENDDIYALADRGGSIIGDDIEGGWGDDEIVLGATRGGLVDFDEIDGGSGNDDITLFADRGGRVVIDDGIEGGTGYDDIVLRASRGGDIRIDGDISGGDQNDDIHAFADRGGTIIGDDIEGGSGNDEIVLGATRGGLVDFDRIEGGSGHDDIFAFADRGGRIEIDQGISGGDGHDDIVLVAGERGDIWLGGDINGADDNDDITVIAYRGGEVRGENIWGDAGDDEINLIATRGGEIDFDFVNGGSGNDDITVIADRGGRVEIDGELGGWRGHDDIVLRASRGGDIRLNDVDGGDDHDDIYAFADRGGSIIGDDIRGGRGNDEIVLGATLGGLVDFDEINGGSGNDDISVFASRGGRVEIDDGIYGGRGHDDILLSATRGGRILVDDDISGGDGHDDITLIAAFGGDIEVDGDVRGGDGNDEIFIGAYGRFSDIAIDGDIEGNDGNDRVTFSNLDNRGFFRNFDLGGDVDGGRGFDILTVTDGSDLALDDVDRFERLRVVGGSYLDLQQRYSNFVWNGERDGGVFVSSDSYLRLSDERADLDAEIFVLAGPNDTDGYRAIFTGVDGGVIEQTGGVLDVAGRWWNGTSDTRVEIANAQYNEDGRFVNKGTIALHSGLTDFWGDSVDVAGDRFRINGDYEGGGNLLLDTFVFDSNSITDRLVIDGSVAGGEANTTTIYVNNTNTSGIGALTGRGATDGIKLVDIRNGNESPDEAFRLAQNVYTGDEEVLVGAYSYRLVQAPTGSGYAHGAGNGDWYLQSGYSGHAAGYATVSSAAQRHFFAGFDTLYKRIGELRQQDTVEGQNADLAVATKAPAYVPVPAPKFQLWARGGGSDLSYDVSSGWNFDQQTWGLQGGGDYTFDYNTTRISIGAFGGYTWSDADVNGNWLNWFHASNLSLDGWNAGIYATFRETGLAPGAGFYADIVGKVDMIDVDMSTDNGVTANTDATVWGVSAEIGYGFDIGNGFVLQPQAQLTYANVSQDAYFDSIGTYVSPDDADSLIGRLGLQIQTTIVGANGQTVTPWAILNVQSDFMGDNRTNVAGTILTSDIGGTWYNAGAGFTANLTDSVAVFASGEYNFGDVEGWAGSGGLKVRW